jgi:hypothetical protein
MIIISHVYLIMDVFVLNEFLIVEHLYMIYHKNVLDILIFLLLMDHHILSLS